ncbi:hypothetical protein SPSIL_034820 [Sporomusa silvacetica DSM 10669]|uniref:Uncharacterized protein n=2 Tax=Sporomusa silvacetica TaxID=55504 RepID=A0ABZ3IPA3_9FIRM|nr:hypothetical protein SPSIL_21730 [Sporomusa silvacetica DSM 10669]
MDFAKYLSVALLTSLDTVCGGLRAGLDGEFDNVSIEQEGG